MLDVVGNIAESDFEGEGAITNGMYHDSRYDVYEESGYDSKGKSDPRCRRDVPFPFVSASAVHSVAGRVMG